MKTIRQRTQQLHDDSKRAGAPSRSWTSCMGQALDEWQQSVEARLSATRPVLVKESAEELRECAERVLGTSGEVIGHHISDTQRYRELSEACWCGAVPGAECAEFMSDKERHIFPRTDEQPKRTP